LKTIDVYGAGLQILQRRDMRFDTGEFAHHAFELCLKDLPGRRERHALGVAVENRRAQLMFELVNLPAYR
jgi:hypothetical protein